MKESYKYKFVIKEDNPDVGYYVYIYINNNTNYFSDYLQDSLILAKMFVEKRYKIISFWQEINNFQEDRCWVAYGVDIDS